MITLEQFDKKIDNIQHQIDMMERGDSVFKGYVHRQFGVIIETMATKEDLRAMETRLTEAIAGTNDALAELSKNVERMDGALAKVAEKVGVN